MGGPLLEATDVPDVHSSNDRLILFREQVLARTWSAVAITDSMKASMSSAEASGVAVVLLVVGVQRQVVDLVVGVLQHGRLPMVGIPECELPQAMSSRARVDHPHRPRRLSGEPPVLLGGLVPHLPRAVQFVAQAPELHAERIGVAMADAQVRPSRATGWLQYSSRSTALSTPRAEVGAHIISTSALPAHLANSAIPNAFVSSECHGVEPGRAARPGRSRPPSGSRTRSCLRDSAPRPRPSP